MRTIAVVVLVGVLGAAETRAQPVRAPDGSWVMGAPQIAPDGTWVGGRPVLAPNGQWVGTGEPAWRPYVPAPLPAPVPVPGWEKWD